MNKRLKETITLSISPGTKEHLENLALKFDRKWGDKPNISGLLEAIANEELIIYSRDDHPEPKRAAVMDALAQIQEGMSKLLRLL